MIELSWLAGAFLAGAVAVQLKLPAMIGYLLAGVFIGLAGFESTALLEGVAHAGVLLLLFGVGLHLRLRNLINRVVLLGGTVHLAVSTLLFTAVAVPFGLSWSMALFLGVILSFSSTVLAAKDLEQREELGAYYGRVAIGILLVQDAVALGVILVAGGTAPAPWALALPLILFARGTLVRIITRTADDGLLLLLAAVLALGAGSLFEEAGVPGEIGALLMGALLADHARSDELQQRLWALKEFFLVGFFIQVGLLAIPAPGALEEVVGWVLLLVALLPFKAALFFALLTALGLRARTAFLTGSALTSYSEFTLLAGMSGLQHGLIGPVEFSVLTLVTAASFAVNLPANRIVHAVYAHFEPWLVRWQRASGHPDKPLHSLGRATHVVVGMGRTGAAAYDFLHRSGRRVVGLDSDPVVIERHLAAGRRVVFGDALDPELWDGLNLAELLGAVVTVPNLTGRLRTIAQLKRVVPELAITTYALRDPEVPQLHAAGATDVHHILYDAGIQLADALHAAENRTT